MYGRRLPIPLWVQDCQCIADAQILHFRAHKPCLWARCPLPFAAEDICDRDKGTGSDGLLRDVGTFSYGTVDFGIRTPASRLVLYLYPHTVPGDAVSL